MMLISWNWLNEFLTLPSEVTLQEVAEKLTLTGCEVESIEKPCDFLRGVITAKIAKLEKHPDRDSLFVAELDVKDGYPRAICVTAAPNLNVGDIVPYAPPGAIIINNIELGSKEFDGILSQGMMLSAEEIGLPDVADEFGILRLPESTEPGLDFKSLFGLDDAVLEISITPNRGDLLSVLGLAREIYALFPNSELKDIEIEDIDNTAVWPVNFKGITLEHPDCLSFALGLASDISIGPSPLKARILLSLMGMRPISNIVDVSNLTMLLTGQPSHAYDLELLPEKEITVRLAMDKEKITTLDGKIHSLTSEDLVITSGGQPVGIAGVMGGENTEIKDNTSIVALECANFASPRISRTSRKLGIISEAAYRYSRSVDPMKVIQSMKYALKLFSDWGCAKVVYSHYEFSESTRPSNLEVPLSSKTMKRILLWDDMLEAEHILSRLGIKKVREENGLCVFSVPTSRPDITIEEDLVEEVGRIRGYELVEPRIPGSLHQSGKLDPISETQGHIRNIFLSRGYTEVVTYSFIAPSFAKDYLLSQNDIRSYPVELSNPLSLDLSCMRTMMLPGVISALRGTIRSGWRQAVRIFETGRVFLRLEPGSDQLQEIERLTGIVYGGTDQRSPYGNSAVEDFFTVKGDILSIAQNRGVELTFKQGSEPFGHAGQSADIYSGDKKVGYLIRLKPGIEQNMDFGGPVYAFELDLDTFMNARLSTFKDIPAYPAVYRDISLLSEKTRFAEEVILEIRAIAGDLLREIRIFDIYEGKNIPEGQKSLGFSLAYRSEDRTLTDIEVEKVHGKVRGGLAALGYTLR